MISKKAFAVLLVSCLTFGSLAGCSHKPADTKEAVNDSANESVKETAKETAKEPVKETAKEVTLSESWNFDIGFGPNQSEAGNYGIMNYAINFYDTLVTYDNGKIFPGLAKSFAISDDGLVYTFHLREGVHFTDGTPFDAEAVKKNLEMIPLNLGPVNGFFGLVTTLFDQIVVVDPYTVEVHLTHPYYGALNDFSMDRPLAMVSPNAYNDDGSYKDSIKTATMGTGPYMYQGDTDGSSYTFVRNPDYWGEKPEIDLFHVKVIQDNDARQLALRNGEIDVLVGSKQMSYDSFGDLKKAGYGALISDGASNTQYLAFNTEKPPFDDLKVRQAISYAIDKSDICKNVLLDMATQADSIFETTLPYCDVKNTPYDFDKDKAIAMLEEDGWFDTDGDGYREKNGISLKGELLYATSNPVIEDIALVLSSQLKEVGMGLKLTQMEIAANYEQQRLGNYSLAFTSTYGGVWDPHTTITNAKPQSNQAYPLPRVFKLIDNSDQIIDELNVTSDEAKVQEAFNYLLKEINDKALVIPLYYNKELMVYNSDKIKDYAWREPLHSAYISSIKLK